MLSSDRGDKDCFCPILQLETYRAVKMLQNIFADRESETVFIDFDGSALVEQILTHQLERRGFGVDVVFQHNCTSVRDLELELHAQLTRDFLDVKSHLYHLVWF